MVHYVYGYLDTISWCIDLAILYYQAENIYFCGIDMYEGWYIYKNLTDDFYNIFK